MDGKICKRGFEVAPIVLARISMYKNQAKVAQEKQKETSDREKVVTEREMLAHAMEEESRGREKVAKQREEKARVREMIGWEKVTQLQICTCCAMSFFFFCYFFVFSGRMREFGTKPLSLP